MALCVLPVLFTLPVVEIIDADEEGEVGEHAEDQARQEGLGGGVIKNLPRRNFHLSTPPPPLPLFFKSFKKNSFKYIFEAKRVRNG